MVLLILAVIWAAVLIPPFLRSRAEARPADTITAFHHQLAVLRRTGPRAARPGDWTPDGMRPRYDGIGQRYDDIGQGHVSPVATASSLRVLGASAYGGARPISARRNARRRRKDILTALLVAAGTTLVLGAIPALRFLWLVHVAADMLLFGYVALLIRQRNLATERDLKVRLLPTARRHEARLEAEGRWIDGEGGWLGEPALLRRSAT